MWQGSIMRVIFLWKKLLIRQEHLKVEKKLKIKMSKVQCKVEGFMAVFWGSKGKLKGPWQSPIKSWRAHGKVQSKVGKSDQNLKGPWQSPIKSCKVRSKVEGPMAKSDQNLKGSKQSSPKFPGIFPIFCSTFFQLFSNFFSTFGLDKSLDGTSLR